MTEMIMNSISESAKCLTMSSRDIADLVGSRHDKVKQSIERLAARAVIDVPPMGEYLDSLGRPAMEYRINKRDSYVIVAQLSPEFTARLVDRWQELEAKVEQAPAFAIPQTLGEALRLAANLADRVVQQDERIAHLAPRAEAAERLLEADGCLTLQDAAKILGFGPLIFFRVLREHGYLLEGKTVAYQRHIDAGLFIERTGTFTDGHGVTHITPRTWVTPKGLLCLRKRLQKGAA